MTAVKVKVTGFAHTPSHYPWNVLWLAGRVFADQVDPVHEPSLWDFEPAKEPDRCLAELVRHPTVGYPDTIRVLVPELAEGGFHPWVGFIEAPVAAVYAERMDRGLKPSAWVASVPVMSPVEMSTPGLRVYVDWDE